MSLHRRSLLFYAGLGGEPQPSDDYYGGMVAAAIIATIAILLCLFLAFLLVRRPAKPAEPTPARKNGPSYENPAFKVGALIPNTHTSKLGDLTLGKRDGS